MAVSFPQLDVYYIDFEQEDKKKAEKRENVGEGLLKASEVIARAYVPGMGLVSFIAAGIFAALGVSIKPGVVRALKRLFNENRFFIIPSQQELNKFENAHGNDWVINEKSLKQKQYYIRHPKIVNRNLLIEAKSFYDYIEEEQKDEILEYIFSHCPVKHIKIERIDVVETNGKAKVNMKEIGAQGSIDAGVSKKDIYEISIKGTARQIQSPRSQYAWLNNSIMRSISALSEGGSLTQEYESDYTFGLSVGEAKVIGLDLSKHKKYTYTIHVEC